MDPSVSVPIATAHQLADTPAADPELDPDGLRSSTYGFLVSPPRPLHPLVDLEPRKFAHSLKFVFPKITAPASRSFATINASRGATDPKSASDPAVVIIRSCVSILSLIKTGTPCSGPRGPFALRSSSIFRASLSASALISITALRLGPALSIFPILSRYSCVIATDDLP